jgi:ABC-type bacteriocin/lantibiotic exporter with double-glycine peptidase domain
MLISTISLILITFGLAIGYGWQLGLVSLGYLPIILIFGIIFGKLTHSKDKKIRNNFISAQAKAEEVFSTIKTIKILNG